MTTPVPAPIEEKKAAPKAKAKPKATPKAVSRKVKVKTKKGKTLEVAQSYYDKYKDRLTLVE